MNNYSEGQLSIPFDDMIKLKNEQKLQLGVDNMLAQKILLDPHLYGAKVDTSIKAAGHLWSWVAVGIFGYTVYLSFKSAWWWFIPGFFIMGAIHSANKSGNAENILEQATRDKTMYEAIRSQGLWMYQTTDDVAKKYKS